MEKWLLPVTVVGSLALGGCSGLLYSDTAAPVYSSTSVKTGQTTAATSSSNVGVISTDNTISTSIERPSQNTVASNQNNPYSVPQSVQNQAVTVIEEQQQTVEKVESSMAEGSVASVTDPRIREASEVLNETENTANASLENTNKEIAKLQRTADQVATSTRPDSVKAAATQRVEEAKAAATETLEETKTTATKTATEAVTSATETASNTATQTVQSGAETVGAAVATATPPKPASSGSATTALLQEARSAVSAGNYEKAASALERAHRIQPGNAKILYDISQIRYAQGKYRQAESFASKAANYSQSNTLSKKIWTMLANSRKALGNTSGAAAASKKAANF